MRAQLRKVAAICYQTDAPGAMKASFWKILRVDPICQAWLVLPLLVGGLGVYHAGGGHLKFETAFFAAAATGIAAVIVLVQRIRGIYRMVARGQSVPGIIVGRNRFSRRGRIDCEYVFRGKPYRVLVAGEPSDDVDHLTNGTVVELLVDPQNPQSAIVRDLYVSRRSSSDRSLA